MKISDFDFDLPNELIAQTPLKKRSDSRLLCVSKTSLSLKDSAFSEISEILEAGSVLVLNDTKVIPARLIGKKDTGATLEVFVLKKKDAFYEVLVSPFKRVKEGTKIAFNDHFNCEIVKKLIEGICLVKFNSESSFFSELERCGQVPLPPYIHKTLDDSNRYQTIYAKAKGSAAAPTAGLHFTDEIFLKLKQKKITILFLTLHVGLGTFKPVKTLNVEDHHMHSEKYILTKEVCDILNKAKQTNQKIYAVGTTSLRALEANLNKYKVFTPTEEETDIFIYPPYKIKSVDGLITNFHLPKSTLLLLVSSFASPEIIKNAYQYAIKRRYRFFSFGDAMVIK